MSPKIVEFDPEILKTVAAFSIKYYTCISCWQLHSNVVLTGLSQTRWEE